ncbi:uncharacterized protein LOC106872510 [Octopus bimaculoides]|uniref:Uncharacterized protein n=1 Tax=Octopus bimaculoides TaxID=37653 RepID=A0A0L8H6Y5_OCTBM|nr:uncharacterized protein LOC106872510 [Octopus bimaculoides]|eukprot:XP_014775014.1 PREDICTED: uncharacterized protein LOC106872510 [Octopus bimaculoides]
MPQIYNRIIFLELIFILLPILSAICTVKAEDDAEDILGHMINKRNSWWSKKSAIPLTDDYPDRSSLEDLRCDQTKFLFSCYIRLCVSELLSCAKEAKDSKRSFNDCKSDYRMCGLKCMSSATSLSE